MNIILIGFMCCGKSSVAARLAKISGLALFDTDRMIEQKYKKTVQDIFIQNGEEFFRKAEYGALKTAMAGDNRVIATGGGALTSPETAELIKSGGVKVYLKITPQTAKSRNDGGRPLLANLTDKELNDLFFAREKLYQSAADITVNAQNDSPEILAEKIYEVEDGNTKVPNERKQYKLKERNLR